MRARTPANSEPLARCRAPHHGPQSRRRSLFSAPTERRAPSFSSSESVRAFSARARPFSLRLVSPRNVLSLRSPFPLGVARAFAWCSVKSGIWKCQSFLRTVRHPPAPPTHRTSRKSQRFRLLKKRRKKVGERRHFRCETFSRVF